MKQVLFVVLMMLQLHAFSQEKTQSAKMVYYNILDTETQTKLNLTEEQKVKLTFIRDSVFYPKIREMNAAKLEGDALQQRKVELNSEYRKLTSDVLTPEQRKIESNIKREIHKRNKENGF